MGYPGDQGKSGGRASAQPPFTPYGPAPERPEAVSDGTPSWDGDPWKDEPWRDDPWQASAPQQGGPSGTQTMPSFEQAPQGPGPHGAPGETQAYHPGFDQGFGEPPGAGPNGESAAFGPGPGGPGDAGAPDGPDTPRQRRPHPVLITVGAAVAGLLLVGGGFLVSSMLEDDSGAKPAAAPTTPTQAASTPPASPTVPPLEPVKLKSRTTDPAPLTLNEIFGKRTFTAGGEKYGRVAWHAKRDCADAVTGTALVSALRKGGCSQALRATYVRGDGALIGSVGVFNLRTDAAAKVAAKAASAKSSALRPLPGPGITKKIGKGEALGTAEARGHYLVMTWVQRPDGKKIPEASHPAVTVFGRQVIKNSNLSFALAYRATEGKPFRN